MDRFETLLAEAAQIGGRAPEALRADLEQLEALLRDWSRVKNLVSRETLADTRDRHIADSLQIAGHVPAGARTLLDLGSGGGFPALPLAIVFKTRGPVVHMVEANGRKTSFLKAVSRALGLRTQVHNVRAEALEPAAVGPVDVITARAFAPLDALLGYAWPFWGPGTRGLFHKGGEHGEELRLASLHWRYDVLESESRIMPDGVILNMTALQPLTG